MTMQERIRQALDDLATAPEPVELAERALRAARRRRATNVGAGIVAGGVVLALAAVGVTHLPGQRQGPTPPGGDVAPCVNYTSGSNGLPEVPRDQWPDFVAATIAALPARSDYSMQSGNSFCFGFPGHTQSPDGVLGGAYAVIKLGLQRETGWLSIDITIGQPTTPADCDSAVTEYDARMAAIGSPSRATLLLCDELTSSTPLTYVLGHDNDLLATAAYADGTVVNLGFSGGAITAEQLAAAAADPGLYAIIPSAPTPAN